jgi:hypothetical protein
LAEEAFNPRQILKEITELQTAGTGSFRLKLSIN